MDISTSQLVKNIVGAAVRWVLVFAGGILVKKGIVSSADADLYVQQLTPVVLGLALAVIAALWSFYQKKKANTKVDVALSLPVGTTRAGLEKAVDQGVTA